MKHNIKIGPENRKDSSGNPITENVPIFVDVKFNGERLAYFTGFRIDLDKFEYPDDTDKLPQANGDGKEGVKVVKAKAINKRIEGINTRINTYFEDNPKEVSKKELKNILDTFCGKGIKVSAPKDDNSFFAIFTKYIENEVSLNSRRNIQTVLNNWQRYELKRKTTLTFETITVEVLRDFEKYLKTESLKPAGRNSKKLVNAPKSKNTIHRIMKSTRAFWNYAKTELKRQGIFIRYPFGEGYELPGETYGKPIYISIDERKMLFKAELKSERLRHVRDIFVFQCLTGPRVGDIIKFTKANIQNDILSYIPRKTKDGKPVTVDVPLNPIAIEIIGRYDLPDNKLLPFISPGRYNDYIKELFEEIGLTRIVTRLNPRTREEEQIRLCDIATSHMARRSFVGNLFGKVDSGIISSMSGHVKDSKAFSRYYTVGNELKKNAINNLD